jgi:hypothetical protein
MSFLVKMVLFVVACNVVITAILLWVAGATKLSKKVEADRKARFGKE